MPYPQVKAYIHVLYIHLLYLQKVEKLERRADTTSITSYESKALAVPGTILFTFALKNNKIGQFHNYLPIIFELTFLLIKFELVHFTTC